MEVWEEQKAIGHLLREANNPLFRQVVESCAAALLLVDKRGCVMMANREMRRLFGYDADELTGESVDRLVPEGLRPRHEGYVRGFFAAPANRAMGAGRDLYGLRKDGRLFPVEIGLSVIDSPGEKLVLASIIDLTERKRTRQEMANIVERARQAAAIAELGVWDWDLSTNRVRWDQRMGELYGLPAKEEDVDYSVWANSVSREELPQQEAILKETIAKRGRSEREFRIRRYSDGAERIIQANEMVVCDDTGKAVRLVGVNRDVTEQRQAQAVKDAFLHMLEEKNAELERFIYTVSHDLKSPLITIKSFATLASKDADAGEFEKMRSDLVRVEKAAERMHTLLDELLKLSRLGRMVNPPELVSLTSISEEARELVAGRIMERDVTVNISADMPLVNVDRPRMVEVMQNLLDNAVKFMGKAASPRIDVGMVEVEGRRRYFVRDNGIGVEPQYREKIFGLFEKLSLATEGTGVGLALVKRIIELHNGKIWVESNWPNGGTTFWFTLGVGNGVIGANVKSEAFP